jgi:membrane protease YdiL (CAAX protease family)
LSFSIRNPTSEAGSNAATRWFWIVFAVTTAFQVVRLGQDSPGSWLAVDYAMRLAALGLLAVSPVRATVFRWEALRVTVPQLILWLLATGAAVVLTILVGWILWRILPDLRLGAYPRTTGWLYFIDLTFGFALVAIHEELVYRRLARVAFSWLGDGLAMIAATSLVFALFHWWTGLPNIVSVALTGMVLMWFYRAVGALWPAIVLHYLIDLYAFS